MEIKITRKVQEDGRHMSQIVIPDELWRYAHIRRGLMEALSSAAFDFQGSQEELRVRRPNITLSRMGQICLSFWLKMQPAWVSKRRLHG